MERIFVKKLGENSDSACATIVFMGFGGILLFPLLFFTEFHYYPLLWLTFITGIVYTAAFFLYVKALSIGEVSLVSPLYNFNIFFLLIFSAIILHESITVFKVLGITLLIYGVSFLNRQKNFFLSIKAVYYDKACRLMITCSLMIAVARVMDGYIVRKVPPILYALTGSATMLFYLLAYALWRNKISGAIRLVREKPLVSLASGFVNAYSYILMLLAFTVIQVSVAEPVSMISMIITVILAKYVFGEQIRSRLVGAVIMLVGAWLLFV
jgi:transporter family protein